MELSGDPELAARLAPALDTSSDEERTRAHIHGFHAYPARLHPDTARRIIEALSTAEQAVLDPFCGSGTTLVEARLAGRRALGTDINPLSTRLCALKCRGITPADSARFLAAAEQVVDFAEGRRLAKAAPLVRYEVDRELFDVHVLLELDSLRGGIAKVENSAARNLLQLVLSSMLVKVSLRNSDSSGAERPRRHASGFAIRFFGDRTRELLRQMEEFTAALPAQETRPKLAPYVVWQADARSLQPVEAASVDLVVCSPPYPGVYDYFDHHELRLRWLGLEMESFERNEIGAKRRLTRNTSNARRSWISDLTEVCRSIKRVMKPGSYACFVTADCAVRDQLLLAVECLHEAARNANLRPVASVAQERPHFHHATSKWFSDRTRREHLIALQRTS
jgi:SAM-dependent methyltransferase